MRALVKLLGVVAVVAVFSLDRRIELALCGAALLVVVAAVIRWMDRAEVIAVPAPRVTLEVVPLQPPRRAGWPAADDLEGTTVPARLSERTARALHEHYAPDFDRQLAVHRHIDRHGDGEPAADPARPAFDQHRYEQAQQYARAFDKSAEWRTRSAAEGGAKVIDKSAE
jgi:hypothetical protein